MTDKNSQRRILFFSQTFIPDPAAVGQQIADVAAQMACRGYHVRVITSANGYDDPKIKYPIREEINGVEIKRLRLSGFGKKSIIIRMLGAISFIFQCLLSALLTPKVEGIFFSTSPPLIGIVACIAKTFRRMPIVYWAMDLNPDQIIMMGKIKCNSLPARVLEAINRQILKQSDRIFTLDRFMAARLLMRGDYAAKISVLPPWSHEVPMAGASLEKNPFRQRHGLDDKFIVMYSGNHSYANPLTTLLRAAVHYKNDPKLCFLFVGGGSAKKEIEDTINEHNLKNIISLPYEPLSGIGNSLSAADVHVVSLGDNMVGIIHPCKIYGAMAAGRPILFFGPTPSHVSDILDNNDIGWKVSHGDVQTAISVLDRIRRTPSVKLQQMGTAAKTIIVNSMSQQRLCNQICDEMELAMGLK